MTVRRRMARRWVAWSCVAVLNTLGAPSDAGPLTPAQLATLNLGSYPPATRPPEFSGRTAEERIVSVAGLRGKVVLLNFWATWCLECRPEMPAFEELHRKFGAGGLTIVGINAREDKGTVQKYARDLGLTFSLVLDPQGKINALHGVIGLPCCPILPRAPTPDDGPLARRSAAPPGAGHGLRARE